MVEKNTAEEIEDLRKLAEESGNIEEARKLVEEILEPQGGNKETALKMIKLGLDEYVAKNLEKFTGLDKEVAMELIKVGWPRRVLDHLNMFARLDKEVAMGLTSLALGDYTYGNAVRSVDNFINNLDKFTGLDKEIALRLIRVGYTQFVTENLDKFTGVTDKDHKEIVYMMFMEGEYRAVAKNLDKFTGLDKEIALCLIKAKGAECVMSNLDKFTGLVLDKDIALKMIEAKEAECVMSNLDKFTGLVLDKDIALKMIEAKEAECVINNLVNFTGLDKEVAFKLIEARVTRYVILHFNLFAGLVLNKETALKMIEVGDNHDVVQNLENFTGLDKEVAFKLIEAREGDNVAENLDKFTGITPKDHKEIIYRMIEIGAYHAVAKCIDKFTGLTPKDHNEIALHLIEVRSGGDVANYLNKFKGLDKEVALRLIEIGANEYVIQNRDSFTDLLGEISEDKLYGNFKIIYKELKKLDAEYEFMQFTLDQADFFNLLQLSGKECTLTAETLTCFWNSDDLSKFIGLYDLQKLIEANFEISEFDSKKGDEKYRYLWEKFKEVENEPDEILNRNFMEGVGIFGYEKMFMYVGKTGTDNFHDHLIDFPKIILLYERSGLSANQFYAGILQQVLKDTSSYENAESYRHLNQIARALEGADFEENIMEAQEFEKINKLQKLAKLFTDPSVILSSWANLKKFHELHELLKKREILDELKSLREEGKEDLYNYVETLAFHPGIEMNKVITFWQDPEEFLGLDASYTPNNVHNMKKPSNYVEIPHLDLSAEDMRDALVEGKLDKLQSWKPFEITYRIPADSRFEQFEKISLSDLIRKAVGSYREKIKGEAKNPNQLVFEIGKILGEEKRGKTIKAVASVIQGKSEVSKEEEKEIRDLILFRGIGYGMQSEEYKLKVNLKSDPGAVVAGNDTACCMPFGDGKNTLYTFNPVCTLFTVQKKQDRDFRTIAQSVLTEDMFYGHEGDEPTIADIIKRLDSDENLNQIMGDRILAENRPHTLGVDSVETSPNFKDTDQLKKLYQDFFHHYLRAMHSSEDINQHDAFVSTTFNQLGSLPTQLNHYIPLAPMSYSDKTGNQVGILDVEEGVYEHTDEELEKGRVELEQSYITANPELRDGHVKYLTFKDSLPVAYLEGKAYEDNKSLIENLHNMENALIAKDINNVDKERPNLSLKYVDDDGYTRGYMLAYEGIAKDFYKIEEGQNFIYVADLAAQPEHPGVGVKIINGFLELYVREYLNKGNPIPIYAEFREKTSYRILKARLKKMERQLGASIELEEIGTEEKGGETMHKVIIRMAPKSVAIAA